MNYTQLTAEICSVTQNYETDFVASIPVFVQDTEELVYNSVQLPAIRRNVTGTLTSGNKYLSMPTDWLSTFSLAVIDADGNYEYLLNKDVNFIRASYPLPTATGLPKYYAVFDDTSFILGPTPDANYAAELHYFYYPESIVTAGTSWLGDNFETVLLYGSLRFASIFLKAEADVIAMYEGKYQESLALLKQLGDGKDRRDAYRSGQVRVPVV